MILRIFDAFFLQNCICWILFGTLTIIFDVLEEIIGKIIESRYIGICQIIGKIIDIGRRLPQIIGDCRELSAKLSISKISGKLSKNYRYRKIWLIAHPYSSWMLTGVFIFARIAKQSKCWVFPIFHVIVTGNSQNANTPRWKACVENICVQTAFCQIAFQPPTLII